MFENDKNSEIITREVRDLIKDIEEFAQKRDGLIENLKKAYLNASNNN